MVGSFQIEIINFGLGKGDNSGRVFSLDGLETNEYF